MSEKPKIVPDDWSEMFIAESWVNEHPCAVQKFIFTTALLVDVSFDGMTYDYSARYCYENPWDALNTLLLWDGEGDPPGPWVKEKISERLGPGALK